MKKRNITLCISLLILLFLTVNSNAKGVAKIDASLKFLMDSIDARMDKTCLPRSTREIIDNSDIRIMFKADHLLSSTEISKLESRGLQFSYDGRKLLHSGLIYGVRIPKSQLKEFLASEMVIQATSVWKPCIYQPLDVSGNLINAPNFWELQDLGGDNCTGEGITISDVDSGIDVTHPVFFNADGGEYSWLDVNGNSQFDSGIDGVDLNGNSTLDSNEYLRFIDGVGDQYGTQYWNDGVYDLERDWLYNDANNDGSRNYGVAMGYTDADPCFGERLFLVDDVNLNGEMELGEYLVSLGSSKISYTLSPDNTTRQRGIDLIETPLGSSGHGTGVAGILVGQNYGFNRLFKGIAPDADLLMIQNHDMSMYIPWARNRGASVMLYEFSGITWFFMDGSSIEEQLISNEATVESGAAQVVPAGNMAGDPASELHAKTTVPGAGILEIAAAPVAGSGYSILYGSIRWRDPANEMEVYLENPGGTTTLLSAEGYQSVDDYWYWSRVENSSRGTRRFDVYVHRNINPSIDGTWNLTIVNQQASDEVIHCYLGDDLTSWGGGFAWQEYNSNDGTVTWPATADSTICVGSYASRPDYWPVGELSRFSGRGMRLDGVSLVDIAAPGNYDIWTAAYSGSHEHGMYCRFGGTSAAGPHVAAASALLLQKNPSWQHLDVETEIHNSALDDGFTGNTPNDDWGYGKLWLNLNSGSPELPATGITGLCMAMIAVSLMIFFCRNQR